MGALNLMAPADLQWPIFFRQSIAMGWEYHAGFGSNQKRVRLSRDNWNQLIIFI
jgi:hypothetical protein